MNNITFDELLKKLFTYYNVEKIKELNTKLGLNPGLISVWKSRNSISSLLTALAEKDNKALIYATNQDIKQSSISISNILLERIKADARKIGQDVNDYVEFLLIKSIKQGVAA